MTNENRTYWMEATVIAKESKTDIHRLLDFLSDIDARWSFIEANRKRGLITVDIEAPFGVRPMNENVLEDILENKLITWKTHTGGRVHAEFVAGSEQFMEE